MPRALAACAAIAVLTAAAGAGGCGEKEEPAAASADSFITDGDRICQAAQDELADLRSKPTPSPEATAALTEDVIGVYEDEISDLAALDPPPDLADEMDAYLAARRRSLAPLRKGLEAARSADAAAYADAQAAAAAGQVKRTELATAVGFSECSRPGAAGEAASPSETPAP
jgi:hypothetical protein